MNKGKFASLIMLGVFSVGVASSSAVSAQGDSNLASTVDISIGSHDDSVAIDPKVSNEPMVAADETNIDAETTTDEETQDDSTDEDNNNASADTEISDKDIEDKADSPEDSDKENSKNKDYVFAYIKEQNVKKSKGVGVAEGLAVAGGGAIMVGSATSGISKLVKSSGYEKKNEPSPEPTPEPKLKPEPKPDPEPKPEPKPDPEPKPEPNKKEEKGGFGAWYKNNLLISLPLTVCFFVIVIALVSLYKSTHTGFHKVTDKAEKKEFYELSKYIKKDNISDIESND